MTKGDRADLLSTLTRDRPTVMRVRVLGRTRIRRRRLYRVELLKHGEPLWSVTTLVPVNTIEPAVGMQEAWALTHEADRLWDSKLGEWVDFAIGPR